MFNHKFSLPILAVVIAFLTLLLIQQQVFAQWSPPPSNPGEGNVNPPLTNPLEQDLDFQDPNGPVKHSILNAQNGTFAGTVQGGTVRGTNLCIGASCKASWPTGDVTNPMTADLDGGSFGINNLTSCKPKDGDQCGAIEANAGVNETAGPSTFSVGVLAETDPASGNNFSYGVYGVSNNNSGVGIFGYSTSGWAGYFVGPLGVTGTSIFYGNSNVLRDPDTGLGGTLTVENQICLNGDCRNAWPAGGGGGDVTGSGTANYLPRWTSASALGNSVVYQSGNNVGIGTITPNRKLHIYDTAQNAELDIQSTAAASSHWGIYHDAGNDDLFFWKDANNRVVFTDNGNVGIGVDNPGARLDINGNILLSGTNPNTISASADNNLRFYTSGGGDFEWNVGGTPRMNLYDNGTFVVPGSSANQFVVQQTTGNVGIHSGTPSARLHLETAGLAAGGIGFRMGGNGIFYVDGPGVLGGRLTILENGNVGIGLSTPGQKLEVSGNIRGTQLCIGADCRSSWPVGGASQWTTSGSNIYYNSGNVGIGITTPDSPLTFGSITGQKMHLYGGQVGGYAIGVEPSELRIAGGTGGSDAITFRTQGYTGTERLRITGSGNVQFMPGANTEGIRIISAAAWSPLNIRNNANSADIFRVDQTGSLAVGIVPWDRLSNYPAACPAGQYVTAVGGSLTCSTPAVAPGGINGSGTQNYITKWTAGDTVGDSQIIDNGTNVGIGVNPTDKLTVDGNIALTHSNGLGSAKSILAARGRDDIIDTSNSGTYNFRWFRNNTAPQNLLMQLDENGDFTVNNDGTTYGLYMNSASAVFRRNVGVGGTTFTPNSALHVADNYYAQFQDNNAGAPSAGDCDAANELGRISIDTTNNRLYVCMGASRGWDYLTLTN